ncbi:MAG: NAD(P)-dependent oxidoreductase [Verrucomicrobia bacterium]|nr:NAD(P)-dependent oxidoreductase [Verrucomicrobiota bacterium]
MNLQGVRALVTGGSGFVGSRFARWLATKGAVVTALVRQRGDHPGLESANITQVEGDFTDPATARRACAGQALVVHAAATVSLELAEAVRVNVTGTGNLAAAAREAGCGRFIYISTLSVYDFQSGATRFDEDAPRRVLGGNYGHSPAASPYYGTTKAEGERALEAEIARGLPATTFRLAAVLGVHPTSSWVAKVPAKVREGKVALRGDGSDVMPWTHIDNVIHAVALALDQPRSIGRAYNVVDGQVAWRDFAGEMRSWFPDAPPLPKIPIEQVRPRDYFILPCVGDRLRAELGYKPVRDYADSMAEAGAWWRAKLGLGS